jgi:hypothetical protein
LEAIAERRHNFGMDEANLGVVTRLSKPRLGKSLYLLWFCDSSARRDTHCYGVRMFE